MRENCQMWCSRLFPLCRNVFKMKVVSSPWSACGLKGHSPLCHWPCWWEPLWNGLNSTQGQGSTPGPQSQPQQCREQLCAGGSLRAHFTFLQTPPQQEQLCTSHIPSHTLLPEPSTNRTNSATNAGNQWTKQCFPKTENPTGEKLLHPQEFAWLKTKLE